MEASLELGGNSRRQVDGKTFSLGRQTEAVIKMAVELTAEETD
jgi:hypothetical protein